jgi:ornithine carbamoyltransferase
MKTFFNAKDLGDITAALAEAQEVKANRYGYQHLGKNKTLLMVFFNNSLRTRLSTQKAAMNLGMNVIVLDVNAGAWKLETERGVIMDGDKSEHLLEAIPVMGSFCDLIGIRSFAGLTDREYDYAETIVNQFVKEQKNLSYSLRKVAHPFKSSLNSMLLPILSQPEAFAALTNVNYVKNAIFENYFEQFSHFSTV